MGKAGEKAHHRRVKKLTHPQTQSRNSSAHTAPFPARNKMTVSPSRSHSLTGLPSHEEIAVEAEVLWRQNGCPVDCDAAFWLEAESQLLQVAKAYQREQNDPAMAEPLSRLDPKSDDVMGELEELFPLQPATRK